jgi:hypothetical protein
MTRDGTLWLDYPSVGGPSPQIKVVTKPEHPSFHYRHSNWFKGGEGWPWVAVSAVEGLEELTLHDLKPGRYTVRLFFAEIGSQAQGDRIQTIDIQGRTVLDDFDIRMESGDSMSGIVREIADVHVEETFTINLRTSRGKSLISGLELLRSQ